MKSFSPFLIVVTILRTTSIVIAASIPNTESTSLNTTPFNPHALFQRGSEESGKWRVVANAGQPCKNPDSDSYDDASYPTLVDCTFPNAETSPCHRFQVRRDELLKVSQLGLTGLCEKNPKMPQWCRMYRFINCPILSKPPLPLIPVELVVTMTWVDIWVPDKEFGGVKCQRQFTYRKGVEAGIKIGNNPILGTACWE